MSYETSARQRGGIRKRRLLNALEVIGNEQNPKGCSHEARKPRALTGSARQNGVLVEYEREFHLTLQKGDEGLARLPKGSRQITRTRTANPTVSAKVVGSALKKTVGSEAVIAEVPAFALYASWLPVATFSVCQKTGTATYLDIWDSDHFDGFTDMQRNLSDCKVWFSEDGFASWGSGETKTGRINCFFRAPTSGNYACNVQLESYGGSAIVECVIDSSSFGPLPFNGSINQPHPCSLDAGYHHFRIRQMQGSFFFVSLSVFRA